MSSIYNNKVVVITGAGSGIGRALSLYLTNENCNLAISDVNVKGLARLAVRLRLVLLHVVAVVPERRQAAVLLCLLREDLCRFHLPESGAVEVRLRVAVAREGLAFPCLIAEHSRRVRDVRLPTCWRIAPRVADDHGAISESEDGRELRRGPHVVHPQPPHLVELINAARVSG